MASISRVRIDPAAWHPPAAPAATGVYAPNSALTEARVLARAYLGAESVAVEETGLLFTGVRDGRILRVDPATDTVDVVATAGDPLGIKIHPDGRLVVADADLGLIAVDPADGAVTVLADHVHGEPIMFADDLAITESGTVYFTEASTRFANADAEADWWEHRPNGRLLVYDPTTGTVEVVVDRLYFANGVTLSPDEDYLLINETTAYRVLRHWLSGPRAGQTEVFADTLPGAPDNITTRPDGIYWVALAAGPKTRAQVDPWLPHPSLRHLLWRLPQRLRKRPPREGYVLALDRNGQALVTLQDPDGTTCYQTSSVIEHDQTLYIGSFSAPGIATLPAPAL